jgi:hypothetical protein
MPIDRWLPQPSDMLDFQEPGRVRLFAHYRYDAGASRNAVAAQPPVGDAVVGIPAFELLSKPVEFSVVRPLDIVVTAKAPLPIQTKKRLSEIVDIQLVNRSNRPIEVSPHATSAQMSLSGQFPGWAPLLTPRTKTRNHDFTIQPNESVSIFDATKFEGRFDATWEYPVPDTVKLRATFHLNNWKQATVIRSNWADVKAVDEKNWTGAR